MPSFGTESEVSLQKDGGAAQVQVQGQNPGRCHVHGLAGSCGRTIHGRGCSVDGLGEVAPTHIPQAL